MNKMFTCEQCNGEFPFIEEEDSLAWEEYEERFPEFVPQQAAILCDACYERILGILTAELN